MYFGQKFCGGGFPLVSMGLRPVCKVPSGPLEGKKIWGEGAGTNPRHFEGEGFASILAKIREGRDSPPAPSIPTALGPVGKVPPVRVRDNTFHVKIGPVTNQTTGGALLKGRYDTVWSIKLFKI